MENYNLNYQPKYDSNNELYDVKSYIKLDELISKIKTKFNKNPDEISVDIEDFNIDFDDMLLQVDNQLDINIENAKILHKDLNRYLDLNFKLNVFKEADINTYKNIMNSYKHYFTPLPFDEEVNSYYSDLTFPDTNTFNKLNITELSNNNLNLNYDEKTLDFIFNVQKIFNPNLNEVLTFDTTAEFNNFFKYMILKQQQIFESNPNDQKLHLDIQWKLYKYLLSSKNIYNLESYQLDIAHNMVENIKNKIDNTKYN